MKAFSGLLAFLGGVLLLVAIAFIAIAITTGQSVRFWVEPTAVPTAVPTTVPTAAPTVPPTAVPTVTPLPTATVDTSVEIIFVFCSEPSNGTELTADTCSPLSIREDSKAYVQMANGDPITIDGFKSVKTGFKIRIDSGDTVVAISIENPYFPTTTFGEAALKLDHVTEPRTVYLPLPT